VDAYELRNGKTVYLLSEGRLVNLAAGQGHPVEIMDMSFAVQYLCALKLWTSRGKLRPGVHAVPADIDREVAQSKLASLGVKIDRLTAEQSRYIASWKEGT
jgi:adenosylhomocysteinase